MDLPTTNGSGPSNGESNNFAVKVGLARMLKGGVIMDVVDVKQVSDQHPCVLAFFWCLFSIRLSKESHG